MTKKILIVCLIVFVWSNSAWSASKIELLGADENRGEYWRSTNYEKVAAFDPRGDDAYGTDGYYCIQSSTPGSGGTVIQSLPAYISSVDANSSLSTYSGYAALDNPEQPIGVNISNMAFSGVWYKNGSADTYYKFFSVTLAQDANFVLAVILDTQTGNPVTYGAPAIKVVGPGTISSEKTGLSADGTPDYVFFEITGSTGDTFEVLLQTTADGGAATAGLGFETVLPDTVTPLGLDINLGQYWRSTNYDKPVSFDPSGDDAYGTDGYYCIQSATAGGTRTVIQSLPTYISSVSVEPVSTYSGYATLDDPTQAIGTDVSNMPASGIWYKSAGALPNILSFSP